MGNGKATGMIEGYIFHLYHMSNVILPAVNSYERSSLHYGEQLWGPRQSGIVWVCHLCCRCEALLSTWDAVLKEWSWSSPLLRIQKQGLRDALKEKIQHYLGIFPKRQTPPLLGTPYQKKNLVFILHFRLLGTFLIFTKKLKFCQYFYFYFWE